MARLPITYRAFIDDMVEAARMSVTADRIAASGHAERTNTFDLPLDATESARKALFKSLTKEQRKLLSEMLVDERVGGIHDVLAYLEWAVSCEHLKMIASNESFAGKPNATMHHDFISRLAGDDWE